MKLSIVMRTWNRLEYTIRTIVSIDRNSGLSRDEYEIIIVDQGSDDGTKDWIISCIKENYYPIKVWEVDNEVNVGDGLGMQKGILIADGNFIAQHDNDIELVTEDYYKRLIRLYEYLEEQEYKVCAVGGSHVQGINIKSSPHQFARKRYKDNFFKFTVPDKHTYHIWITSWVTASFIFRKEFASREFGKGMCNSWCGAWWDEGYDNFISSDLNFWHIDSTDEGGEYVKKQAEKFPSYTYISKNYRRFIK